MTWLPTKRPRPGSVDWAAQEILRILDREEAEAAEASRLQREGWQPPHPPQSRIAEDRPVLGDGRDALVDLVQSKIDRRRALLNEARRRVDERQRHDQQAPRPNEAASRPPASEDASHARNIGGLLGDWEPGEAIHPVTWQEPLSNPHSNPRFQHANYQPPLFLPGGAPIMGRGAMPHIHGAGILGAGRGGVAPAFTWEQILAALGIGTAGVAAEEARRRLAQDGVPTPPPDLGTSLPRPPVPTSSDLPGDSRPEITDNGRLENRPPRLHGGVPGHPGNPEPPRDRHPERPKPPALQDYPGLAEWIEQEGLILQNSKGDAQTQADNDYIIERILKGLEVRGIVAKHTRGGSTKKEMYYPARDNQRKGSGRTDGQVEAGDERKPWDFNTVDTLKDREMPTARERRAIEKIKQLREIYYKGKSGYFDAFPKSRGWNHDEWKRAMAKAIEEFLDARFGPPTR